VQLSSDVKSNILKALELNPKDSACLHILGIWHFNVANLDFMSRTFVKVSGATCCLCCLAYQLYV
jgi:hypothetical protein